MVDTIADPVMEAYERDTEASKISDLLSFGPLEDSVDDLIGPLESVYSDAGESALNSLEITDTGLFNLLHEDARAYASDRAAELVGKQFVAGVLVDNPDAEWAITETTRDGLRSLIERAFAEGMSPAKLGKEIKATYAFSTERSALIAKTETSRASIQGSLAGWKRSGVVEGKSSQLSDDHDKDDECNDNEDDGVIGIDSTFSSGDDGPPYHPECNCALIPELIDQGDDDEEI